MIPFVHNVVGGFMQHGVLSQSCSTEGMLGIKGIKLQGQNMLAAKHIAFIF